MKCKGTNAFAYAANISDQPGFSRNRTHVTIGTVHSFYESLLKHNLGRRKIINQLGDSLQIDGFGVVMHTNRRFT